MKKFQEFDPLHPQKYEETLQIRDRKVHLSYIPLVNSVSIRGYLPESILSDVSYNTFWVDYRFEDGYRSANGEIIFDSSANNHFIDVTYLGIGTVLRANDMNEVAESLESLDKSRNESQNDINNLKIRDNIIELNAKESLTSHNQNLVAHKDIRDSIKASLRVSREIRQIFIFELNA